VVIDSGKMVVNGGLDFKRFFAEKDPKVWRELLKAAEAATFRRSGGDAEQEAISRALNILRDLRKQFQR
jgi:hypothetical protein